MLNKISILENYLTRGIKEHRFLPGKKIPSRNVLSKRFNCSRTTVEFVIQKLIKSGLLGSRKGSGTFVLAESPSPIIRKAVFVYKYDIVSLGRRLGWKSVTKMFNDLNAEIPVEMMDPDLCDKNFDQLSEIGTAVIWMTPEPELIYFMRHLKNHGTPQFLINREYIDCDSISTDQEESLRKGLHWLLIKAGRELAMVSPAAKIEKPYIMERCSCFYKCALELGFSLPQDRVFIRDFNHFREDIMDVGANLFDSVRRPKGICVLDSKIAFFLLEYAKEQGCVPGRDFHLLMFDWDPDLVGTPGVAMLRQPFEVFLAEAHNWIHSFQNSNKFRHSRRIAELILPPSP